MTFGNTWREATLNKPEKMFGKKKNLGIAHFARPVSSGQVNVLTRQRARKNGQQERQTFNCFKSFNLTLKLKFVYQW